MNVNLVLTGVVALCVVEALVISWLLWQRAKSKRVVEGTDDTVAKEALPSLGGRLLEAQEQERSRIARELHDDISQRLALLSIELQQMDFDSPADMRIRSEELFQHIADISRRCPGPVASAALVQARVPGDRGRDEGILRRICRAAAGRDD